MSNIYFRLNKRYKMTVSNWKRDCEFSKKLACLRLVDEIGGRIGLRRLAKWAHFQKEKWILDYLQDVLEPVIHKYKYYEYDGVADNNAPIWICWWSGEDKAPELVKQCIKSIKKNGGKHPVKVVTQNNYFNYIDVPEYILNKLKKGKMGIAHFADYLRVCLIQRYCGLWLDATMFCVKTISEDIFELPFFTCKSKLKKGCYLSDFQWTTFCLGGWRNHVFYQFMKEAFESYWRVNETAVDYLFFDDIIYLAKENVSSIGKALEEVPVNNEHRDDLQAAMNAALPANEFWNVIKDDTILYKLSWREVYSIETEDKQETVYGYFLKMRI